MELRASDKRRTFFFFKFSSLRKLRNGAEIDCNKSQDFGRYSWNSMPFYTLKRFTLCETLLRSCHCARTIFNMMRKRKLFTWLCKNSVKLSLEEKYLAKLMEYTFERKVQSGRRLRNKTKKEKDGARNLLTFFFFL